MILQKAEEINLANKTLFFLGNIEEAVFNMTYLADKYQDDFDRVIAALEVAKERFEDLKLA